MYQPIQMNQFTKLRLFKYPILFGLYVCFVTLLLTQLVTYQRYQILKNKEQQEVISHANWIEKEFQKILNQSFTSTQTLAFIVENYGVPNNFDSIAKLLLNTNKQLSALELVDSTGVITHVYPLEGNRILGLNILQDSIGKKGANITLKRKDYFVAGPIHLKQGGDGFVSRVPIFKENTFKGFSAAVIKLPNLLKALDLGDPNNRFSYQLTKINADKSEELFFSSNEAIVKSDYSITVATTNGEWKLHVIAKKTNLISTIYLFALLGLILSIIAGVFSWYLLIQPSRLDKMVDEKTALLHESEEKYKTLVEQASDGIAISDINGRFLDANIKVCSLFGYSKQELLSINLIELIDKEFLKTTPLRIDELKQGKTILTERKLVRKDGTTFYGEVTAKMLTNGILQGIVRDITERKELERTVQQNALKIQESEEKYRTLVNFASDGIFILDQNINIVDVNLQFCAMFGGVKTDFVGKSIIPFIEPVNLKETPLKYAELLEGNTIRSIRKLLRKDGSIFIGSTSVKMMPNKLYQGIVNDVTEREKATELIKKSEQKYRELTERITDAFIAYDKEWNVTFASPRALEFLGQGEKSIIGKNIKTILPDAEKNEFYNAFLNTMVTQEYAYILTFYEPFGIWLENHVYPSPEGVSIYFRDVTEREKTSDLIKKSELKYKELTERISDAFVAFDINWNFTYISAKANAFIPPNTPSPIGKNVWEEFPHFVNSDVHAALITAMETQSNKSEQRYSQALDKWIEYRVYPSKNGVSVYFSDITAVKIAEDRIKDAKAKMESAIRIGKIGYWSWDIKDNSLEWSDQMYVIFDMDKDTQLNFESATNSIHPEDRKKHEDLINQRIQNKDNTPFSYRVIHKDKSIHYVLVELEILVNENNDINKLHGTLVDITDRVMAQEELKESQEKFYKSFHSNLIGKVIVDENRIILEANNSIAKTLETTRENLIGKALIDADVLDYNLHEQSEKRKLLWNKVFEQGFLLDEEFTYTLKSGKKIPALLSIEPLQIENKTTFLVSAFDNTKRKEAEEDLLKSEERFRKLAATTPVGIFQSDEKGACTYVNAEWLKYSGMQFDEAMGTGWINATYPPDRKRVLKEWEKTVTDKKEFKSKFRLQHKNGKIITISVKATPLFGLDDSVIGFIGMASDISSLIKVEERLEAQNVELLKTNSELDRFVYSASHELRAPLASVLGLINIILSEEEEAGLVFKLEMMQQSVNRLDSFIKDIVQYSQNKHLEIDNEKIEFRSIVNDSLESLWYLENRSKINIQVNISEEIEFYSDKKRISIVLNNLISNAIKYHDIEKSNPVITIEIKTAKNNAKIKISDNGVGIPEEHLSKIFEMFYRVSSKVMGTGIGLYVVKEIIEKINGKILVESKENNGTTFFINLPNKKI